MKAQKIIIGSILVIIFTSGFQTVFGYRAGIISFNNKPLAARPFLRTELYFGMDKNDGSTIRDEDWNKVLAQEVTPKFPSGFTVLEAFGQFQGKDRKIVREKSKVLILMYALKDQRVVNRKIEQIRNSYKKTFQQQSVMRMDLSQAVRVSF